MKSTKFIKSISNFKNQTLNESSFFDFKFNDIVTPTFMKEFIHDDIVDSYLDIFIQDNNLDDDNEDDIRESQPFVNFMMQILMDNFKLAKENIYDKFDEHDKILIYRAITVDDNWLNHLKSQGKRLGIFWSWDENGAETHQGNYDLKNIAVIEAEIAEKYIDWKTTLIANIHPSFIDEQEITLFKNTPINIKSITINDEIVDISFLNDKNFYA